MPTAHNILKETENPIHGKELNLEMPLHSYYIFECMHTCILMKSFKKKKKKQYKKRGAAHHS